MSAKSSSKNSIGRGWQKQMPVAFQALRKGERGSSNQRKLFWRENQQLRLSPETRPCLVTSVRRRQGNFTIYCHRLHPVVLFAPALTSFSS